MLAARSSTFMSARVTAAPRAAIPAVTRTATAVEVECKIKTKKAAAKRFRLTGSGKLMARHCGKQHLNEKMSRGQIQKLSKDFVVSKDKAKNIAACLPNHGLPH